MFCYSPPPLQSDTMIHKTIWIIKCYRRSRRIRFLCAAPISWWCSSLSSCLFLFCFFSSLFSKKKKKKKEQNPRPSSWTGQAFHLAPNVRYSLSFLGCALSGSSLFFYIYIYSFSFWKRITKIKKEKKKQKKQKKKRNGRTRRSC